jgi:hypothetical protein
MAATREENEGERCVPASAVALKGNGLADIPRARFLTKNTRRNKTSPRTTLVAASSMLGKGKRDD